MHLTIQKYKRRFLVPTLKHLPVLDQGIRLSQGFLVRDELSEVSVTVNGDRYSLRTDSRQFPGRNEVRVPISTQQFEALWPLTEGRRVEKVRHLLMIDDLPSEIDVYEGSLATLRMASLEFSGEGEAAEFNPPEYFGLEITDDPNYRDFTLASHGLPPALRTNYQLGALPYLIKNGTPHVVLITSSSGNRWIVPKGQPEPDMTHQEVVLMEAVEEAGVIGSLVHGIHAQCRIRNGHVLHLHPLHVSLLLKKWPESAFRKRIVLPVEEAIEKLPDQPLGRCIRRLMEKLDV